MAELTPMLVQYLVGLCCLQWDPEAVDVTIGDMVLDAAAEKERDVDVTVTVSEHGEIHAFKGYEVKHEKAPLDVTVVEGLCLKLLDMPAVTHRAIASSSGFSDGARAKAASHRVSLLHLKPWTRPLEEQFPLLGMRGTVDECFPGSNFLLFWIDKRMDLVATTAPGPFSIAQQDPLFSADGKPHAKFRTMSLYEHALELRSTQTLFSLEPAATVLRTFPILPVAAGATGPAAGPAWPHTHTLDVGSDEIFLNVQGELRRLDRVTISGMLQWQRGPRPQHYILENIADGSAFAGALIAVEPGEGRMTALLFSPKTRDIGVRFVRLAEKHKNAIRRLKLPIPS
jgi:hypothetical protein